MKKIFRIIGIGFVLFLGGITYKYYHDTYVGQTAYAIVPEQVPNKEITTDDSGQVISNSYSYHYTLTFITKKGAIQTKDYEIFGSNPTSLTPNSYVTAEISKKRIVEGPNPVAENQIPKNVLTKLK